VTGPCPARSTAEEAEIEDLELADAEDDETREER